MAPPEPTGKHRSRVPSGEPAAHRGKRSRRWIVVVFIGLVLLGLYALLPLATARTRLTEAREAAAGARAALLLGDFGAAHDGFAAAEEAFAKAGENARNPVVRLAGLLPLFGRSVDAVRHLADAGARVARAGTAIAASLQGLPEGTGALAPQSGTIPLQPFGRLAPAVEDARGALNEARALLERTPDSWLLGAVADARKEFDRQLEDAERTLRIASALIDRLPSFFGRGETRRYLVGAQNPAELRGTGGIIGAYAILTVKDGRFRLGQFSPIQDLGNRGPSAVPPPNPDYATRYNRFGGTGFWLNINMTPDFPSAAVAIERLYREITGTKLDGVVLADPFALSALLRVAGPVEVPLVGATVDADTVVSFVSNEAYAQFADSDVRKRLLGEVAREALGRFLEGGVDPIASARALADAAAGGHLLLHSVHPPEQAAFEVAEIAGAMDLPTPLRADYLAVIGNNEGGNKLDFYAEREVSYTVRLTADGAARGRLSVRLANEAPDRGQPTYVLGPAVEGRVPGENATYLSVLCGRSCQFGRFLRDGRQAPITPETELGHHAFTTVVDLESGRAAATEYEWLVPDAWTRESDTGIYRLVFRGQPTIRPTALRIEIVVPPGMRVAETAPGMRVVGDSAIWEGVPGDLMVFDVALETVWLLVG